MKKETSSCPNCGAASTGGALCGYCGSVFNNEKESRASRGDTGKPDILFGGRRAGNLTAVEAADQNTLNRLFFNLALSLHQIGQTENKMMLQSVESRRPNTTAGDFIGYLMDEVGLSVGVSNKRAQVNSANKRIFQIILKSHTGLDIKDLTKSMHAWPPDDVLHTLITEVGKTHQGDAKLLQECLTVRDSVPKFAANHVTREDVLARSKVACERLGCAGEEWRKAEPAPYANGSELRRKSDLAETLRETIDTRLDVFHNSFGSRLKFAEKHDIAVAMAKSVDAQNRALNAAKDNIPGNESVAGRAMQECVGNLRHGTQEAIGIFVNAGSSDRAKRRFAADLAKNQGNIPIATLEKYASDIRNPNDQLLTRKLIAYTQRGEDIIAQGTVDQQACDSLERCTLKMNAAQVAYDAIEPKREGEARFRQLAGKAFNSIFSSDEKPYGHQPRWPLITKGLQAFTSAEGR